MKKILSSKKAVLEMTLVNLILVGVSLLVLIGSIIVIRSGFDKNNPDDICAMSASVSSISADFGQGIHLIDFKCPVRMWYFRMGEMGEIKIGDSLPKKESYIPASNTLFKKGDFKWYVPFSKDLTIDGKKYDFDIGLSNGISMTKQDAYNETLSNLESSTHTYYSTINKTPGKYRIMDQQDFMNEQIAKRMYRCSTKLGEGKLNIFNNNFKSADVISFCVVCDIFDFSNLSAMDKDISQNLFEVRLPDGDLAYYGDGEVQTPKSKGCTNTNKNMDCYPYVNTLDDWMKLWKIPEEGMTFYDYFKNINGDTAIFDSGAEFNYQMYSTKDGKRENGQYAVVYMETRENMWVAKVKGFVHGASWSDIALGAGTLYGPTWLKFIAGSTEFAKFISKDGQGTQERKILFLPVTAIPTVCEQVVNV